VADLRAERALPTASTHAALRMPPALNTSDPTIRFEMTLAYVSRIATFLCRSPSPSPFSLARSIH